MRDGWKRVKLGDIAEVLLGKMLDQKKNRGELHPFLNNVSVRWGGFDLSDLGKMRFESDELERYQIRKGDIVVCEGGESGRCAMWKNEQPILYQKALHRVRVNEGVDQTFVYYQLYDTFVNGKADALITGSTIKHLPRQAMLQVDLLIPPLAIQRRIAAVLGALDDKIELNRKMNANLEAQAQALFKSWFVDFEPWGGKMPEERKKVPLDDLTERLASGGTPRSMNESYYSGNIKWFSTKELRDSFLLDSEKHISEEALNNSAVKMFPRDTVLMAIYASPTLGRLGVLDDDSTFNQAAVGLLAKKEVGYPFIFLTLYNERSNLNNLVSGAAQQNLNVRIVKTYEVLRPDDVTLNRFDAKVRPLFEMIRNFERESRKLAELRDALLPKLMSGELEVA